MVRDDRFDTLREHFATFSPAWDDEQARADGFEDAEHREDARKRYGRLLGKVVGEIATNAVAGPLGHMGEPCCWHYVNALLNADDLWFAFVVKARKLGARITRAGKWVHTDEMAVRALVLAEGDVEQATKWAARQDPTWHGPRTGGEIPLTGGDA